MIDRSSEAGHTRDWAVDRPVPVELILAPLRRGSGDPAFRMDGDRLWRAMRTPEGCATLALPRRADDGVVRARAWGPGSEWALDRLPQMLGADDDPAGFVPLHSALVDPARRHQHLRVGATGIVFEALVPAILEQKVTGHEAWYSWRRLVREHGDPAPGPVDALALWVPPGPEAVRRIPSWTWRQLSVDLARSRAIVQAAGRSDALERTLDTASADADRALRSLPGIGEWTSAEIRQRAHGDSDAVSFGDFHLSKRLGGVLCGEPIDDAEMARLLEPYRPNRYRVQRLVELTGAMPARRHPRPPPRRHLPTHG